MGWPTVGRASGRMTWECYGALWRGSATGLSVGVDTTHVEARHGLLQLVELLHCLLLRLQVLLPLMMRRRTTRMRRRRMARMGGRRRRMKMRTRTRMRMRMMMMKTAPSLHLNLPW